jgi:hypothetical protein
VRNVLRDLEVGVLSRLFAFARGRLAGLSSGRSWATAGSRVFHQKFGCGVVLLAQEHKLTVSFDRESAPKRVVDAFCEPAFDAYDKKSPKAFGA